MSLNQYQQRSLGVTLRLLEKTLDDIEALLAADHQGLLYAVRTEISPEREMELRRLSKDARAVLAEMMRQYELPLQQEDGLRIISARLSSAWENLEDSRPRKLRRYGQVDPEVAEELEPQVEALIRLVLTMERLTH